MTSPTRPITGGANANTGRPRNTADVDNNEKAAKSADLIEEAKSIAADLVDEAKGTARDSVSTLTEEAKSRAVDTKDSLADDVSNVADALRKAADDMSAGSPQERTLGQIANGLADASDAVKNKDLGEIVSDMTTFARRNPGIFLGAAALVGFAGTRFAKASTTDSKLRAPHDATSVPTHPYAGSTEDEPNL